MVLHSLLPNLGREKSYTFSRILMVPTKSDSAATHLSSTQSVGGIILSFYACWEQAPHSLLIMDVWDLITGKIMVVWRGSRQWKQGPSHSQQVLQEQTSIWETYPHTVSANIKADFSNDSIFSNSFSLGKCAKDLSVLQIYLPVSDKDLFLTHCSTFHLHWLSVHRTLDT